MRKVFSYRGAQFLSKYFLLPLLSFLMVRHTAKDRRYCDALGGDANINHGFPLKLGVVKELGSLIRYRVKAGRLNLSTRLKITGSRMDYAER